MAEEELGSLCERDLQEMKSRNYEQFKTLVRMHLSFELHLNTDEFDFPYHEVVYYEKGKLKKWNKLTRKIRACASAKTGSPADTRSISLTMNLISHLKHLKNFVLNEENIKQEGIFRRTGALSRQNELKSLILNDQLINIDGNFTVHDCAAVYKALLADLPEPVLTDAHYPAHCQIADLCNNLQKESFTARGEHLLSSIQLLLLLLPDENRILFSEIIEMLSAVANEKSNKMSADSLATLFAPHLICPRYLPPEVLHYVCQNMCGVISYMITKGSIIFHIPPKLATDIRAYFAEKKRKMSTETEAVLNESMSDISTANTVYTFIDREKTAEAHNSNSTDTALAQLYAHIQSLPESSKKRKLIKQFNKENGQGTPLQLVMLNRINNSHANRSAKSISDSIKRHIFHKGGSSRTPKRTITPSFDTPNSSSIPKIRVLFETPTSSNSNIANSSVKKHLSQKSVPSPFVLTELSRSEKEIELLESSDCGNRSHRLHRNENVNEVIEKSGSSCFADGRTETDGHHMNSHIFKSNDLGVRYNSEPNLSRIVDKESTYFKRERKMDDRLKCLFSDTNQNKANAAGCKRKQSFNLKLLMHSPKKRCLDMISNTKSQESSCRFVSSVAKNVITSTPSQLLERKSMSPITKSTQKMPKSMQESIMTPRSRKPVMLSTTLGSSEQNQTLHRSDLPNFREEDEEFAANNGLLQNTIDKSVFHKSKSMDDIREAEFNKNSSTEIDSNAEFYTSKSAAANSLTNTFRQYLLSRDVLTASPTDSSFSSQSGDFGSTPDFQELYDGNLNNSLLYCLDGNTPKEDSDVPNILWSYCNTSPSSSQKHSGLSLIRENESEENVRKKTKNETAF